jgi:hypothetical protein
MAASPCRASILRDAPIEIGCCRFRHFSLPKSGKPDFGGRSSEAEIISHALSLAMTKMRIKR